MVEVPHRDAEEFGMRAEAQPRSSTIGGREPVDGISLHRLVVVGGGAAGWSWLAALAIASAAATGSIALIESARAHLWQPLLACGGGAQHRPRRLRGELSRPGALAWIQLSFRRDDRAGPL